MSRPEVEGAIWVDPIPRPVVVEAPRDAFTAITPGDVDRAYRLAWAILADDADAQDATQDALTAAWQQRRSLRDAGRIEAWLARIVVNKCRDRLRARARSRERVRSIELIAPPSVVDGSIATADRDELDRALDCLSPDARITVVLRFWADLTVDDIADRLGIPAGTVKSRLHHSMNALRAALETER